MLREPSFARHRADSPGKPGSYKNNARRPRPRHRKRRRRRAAQTGASRASRSQRAGPSQRAARQARDPRAADAASLHHAGRRNRRQGEPPAGRRGRAFQGRRDAHRLRLRLAAALGAADKTWSANQRLAELNSVGRVELDVSEAEVAKAKAEVAANAALIAKCTLAAPFAGRIAEQRVREQQYVQPGQALLEIIDDSQLELEFIVPSKWLVWLKPGHGFPVAIDETGKSYPARVQRIGARVDPVSQSVKLSATIDGKFPELIAGMSGKVLMAPPANQ
jgi:multidrug resistance efflux pump